jgi:hypothetical protein
VQYSWRENSLHIYVFIIIEFESLFDFLKKSSALERTYSMILEYNQKKKTFSVGKSSDNPLQK